MVVVVVWKVKGAEEFGSGLSAAVEDGTTDFRTARRDAGLSKFWRGPSG